MKNVIFKNASLVVFNFTLQFILPNEKDDLIQKVYIGMSKKIVFLFYQKKFYIMILMFSIKKICYTKNSN